MKLTQATITPISIAMKRLFFWLCVAGVCLSQGGRADESGVPREPNIAVELGQGQVKVDVDSLDLPPEVLSRLETELMVDDRLAPLVTGPTIQRITLDPDTTAAIVNQWRAQTQSTADRIREQILLQLTGSGEAKPKLNRDQQEFESYLHRLLEPVWRWQSDIHENWFEQNGDQFVAEWLVGWRLVLASVLAALWAWLVMIALNALLPGFSAEALSLSRSGLLLSFAAGIGAVVAFLPGMIFLIVTIVGLVLLPIYFLVALIALMLTYPVAVFLIGARIIPERPLVWQIGLGQLVLVAWGFIPVLGAAIKVIILFSALGLILRLFLHRIWSTN